ncbi:MAG: UDP-N-acetylmuramate dehydrogenase [bacterium]
MMSRSFADRLTSAFPGEVKFQEPMKYHTSFGIGGPAECLATVKSLDELRLLLSLADEYRQPVFILGRGTNILVRDGGIRGLVIRLDGEFTKAGVQRHELIGGAACPLSSLLRLSVQHKLSGLEFATGIPGAFGGAVCMNAGSAEEGIGSLVRDIHLVYADGSTGVLPAGSLNFSYRHCSLPEGSIITAIALQLSQVEHKEIILARIKERYTERLKSQPLRDRSAGCIFRNPPGESAGRLIDQAGLKGLSIGGAQISTIHANFIINREGASCFDVVRLIDVIREKVYQSSGFTLETEVLLVGEG